MRLVIQHENDSEVIAFEYKSKEQFKHDLFDALEKYLDLTFSDRQCTKMISVNGLKFNADLLISYNALNHPQYDIPEIYTLKEWFSHSALKAEEK